MRVLLALLVAAQNSVVPAPPPPLPPQSPAPDTAHLLIPSREAPGHVGGGDATYRYVSANAAFAPAAPPVSQAQTRRWPRRSGTWHRHHRSEEHTSELQSRLHLV